MGHQALRIGDWGLGMGHWALSIGHWALWVWALSIADLTQGIGICGLGVEY